jgi:hypothetical protein
MSVVHRLATTLAVVVLSCSMLQPAHAPSITAAGDISSPPGGPRGDRRTAGLIRRWSPTAVLALGDTQYEAGELASFRSAYDRSWGAFKARTRPAIGNHEYLGGDGAAGYFDYFGAAAGTGGRSIHPVNRVHPSSVSRVRTDGVYRLILYPDHWVGAFKGVDGNTYDHAGQYCH